MIKSYEVLIKNYFENYQRKEVIKVDSSIFHDKEDEFNTVSIMAMERCDIQENVVSLKLIE